MKYEEWIQYEQIRQRQSSPQDWVMLPPEPRPAPETAPSSQEETNRVWTMVVQIFNSRRI